MNAAHFDSLTKRLTGMQSRRRLLSGSLRAMFAGILGVRPVERAGAKQCKEAGRRCQRDGHCCSEFCDPSTRQCVATCTVGQGTCDTLSACAPGCSCYQRAFTTEMVCLRDPADPPACSGLQGCLDSDDECPRGHLCTASSCCTEAGDAVCLPLCEVVRG
jgi:hypothetical protein